MSVQAVTSEGKCHLWRNYTNIFSRVNPEGKTVTVLMTLSPRQRGNCSATLTKKHFSVISRTEETLQKKTESNSLKAFKISIGDSSDGARDLSGQLLYYFN